MKLLYGEDKYFIGAIKFFDKNKDFGFIASNNCNMPTSRYKQDFYVNSASFIEEKAKENGHIVVFQVELQDNGKKRAVNVRCITHSAEDIALALSYYGEHEYIEYKDDIKINLYNHTFKPRSLEAEKVKSIIMNDKERSPQKTAQHFKFFVEHYKTKALSKECYIFDRDYFKEEKAVWESLIGIFTEEESIEILRTYPSLCKYFDNTEILQRWINEYLKEDSSLAEIRELKTTFDFLPPEIVKIANNRIASFADLKITELYEKISNCTGIDISNLEPKSSLRINSLFASEEAKLIQSLRSYLSLTDNKHEDEKQKCITAVRHNNFNLALNNFISAPLDSEKLESLFNSFESLDKDKTMYQNEMIENVIKIVDRIIIEKKYEHAIRILSKAYIVDDVEIKELIIKLLPLIKTSLCETLTSYLSKPNYLERNFFNNFQKLTQLFNEDQIREIKEELKQIMLQSNSIQTLSICTKPNSRWLSIENSLNRVIEIVEQWQYDDLDNFIREGKGFFYNKKEYNDIIVKKALSLISSRSLSSRFNGKTEGHIDVIYIQRGNCAFLKELKSYVHYSSDKVKNAWNEYINSKNAEEMLILYDNEVISDLPQNIIVYIINNISLDSVVADSSRWYHCPVLKEKNLENILTNTKIDIFPIISSRLVQMELTPESVPLATFLSELITINKPKTDDYITIRNWDLNITKKLQELANSQTKNLKLCVILWATHFKSFITIDGLRETFTLLPPYLQIRCIKKLFQLKEQGKIQFTAESLYNQISSAINPICFPLEITFTYLKHREKDSKATLDNNIMLQLLDGRDDHPEWIGIRQLMTQCYGREQVKELTDDYSNYKRNKFFNGIIKEGKEEKLYILVPNKMIDANGVLQNYNNKHYSNIQELVRISYKKSEYKEMSIQNGFAFCFDKSQKVNLYAIARAFNLKYNRLNNFIDFTKNENDEDYFCECREAKELDYKYGISFYWCANKPCFRIPVRYMINSEWEKYTILDFMRILNIPTDYTNAIGSDTKFGHYIILSAYLKSFAKFYEHLKCRECKKLMKPFDISNFASRAVSQFQCTDENCKGYKKIVYLNHCFNKQKCNATIDSRDSRQCPNEQYICPECGACCSTENFRRRISNLHITGGDISKRLLDFVQEDKGHWEKEQYFCYKCGNPMSNNSGIFYCYDCKTKYSCH